MSHAATAVERPMSYVTACLIVAGAALVAACAAWMLRLGLGLETRRRHHEIGNPVFLQLGLLFAVLLAFVYNDVQAGYNDAAEAINGECGALHGAAMLARALPDGQGKPVMAAIAAYTQAVMVTEWPSMAHRQRSPVASEALRTAMERASLPPEAGSGNGYVQAQILGLLVEAHARRETRIYQMTLGVPALLWVVLIGNAVVLIGFVILAGVESIWAQMMFAAAFAGCTASILVLVHMLDFPFEGALALRDADFAKVAQEVLALGG